MTVTLVTLLPYSDVYARDAYNGYKRHKRHRSNENRFEIRKIKSKNDRFLQLLHASTRHGQRSEDTLTDAGLLALVADVQTTLTALDEEEGWTS